MQKQPFIIGSLIFTLIALIATFMVQAQGGTAQVLGLKRDVALSITASLTASGAFFLVVELFRSAHDRGEARILARLQKLEERLGIKEVFAGKSSAEATSEYGARISAARTRIWAVGLSNNQFIEQHSAAIRARKQKYPSLDVQIFFFDPDATINLPVNFSEYPLVNLFDFPKTLYTSEKRATLAKTLAAQALTDNIIRPGVHYAIMPSYFSLMIVDDIAFFFPYLLAPEDASSHPMMMVDTNGEIGKRLVEHVEQLRSNKLLCRDATAAGA